MVFVEYAGYPTKTVGFVNVLALTALTVKNP
jgi:hypothetical protein